MGGGGGLPRLWGRQMLPDVADGDRPSGPKRPKGTSYLQHPRSGAAEMVDRSPVLTHSFSLPPPKSCGSYFRQRCHCSCTYSHTHRVRLHALALPMARTKYREYSSPCVWKIKTAWFLLASPKRYVFPTDFIVHLHLTMWSYSTIAILQYSVAYNCMAKGKYSFPPYYPYGSCTFIKCPHG